MHPEYLAHQLEASKRNLGLDTIDLMYLQNVYEQQAHFCSDTEFMDKLAKAFQFYEERRQAGDIQYYGMATWLCFRAKPEEERIYLNFQKCVELAEAVGGKNHGMRFVQVPMSVLMPEAFVEKWQHFQPSKAASSAAADNLNATFETSESKILVQIANLLKINLIASKPLLEGRVHEIDIPTVAGADIIGKHLQLMRSMPPRCNISCMVGMKSLANVKSNYSQVLVQEPLSPKDFLKAMNVS